MNTKQNFISVDFKTALSSYGEYFTLGERVRHEDSEAGEATITGFELDTATNEVRVFTTEGFAHLDFIRKL